MVACEDDMSPVIQLWDLRSAAAMTPARELLGHNKVDCVYTLLALMHADPLCAAGAMLGQVVAVRWGKSAGLPVSSRLPDLVCHWGLGQLTVGKRVLFGASS